ncbi:MAG: hypothetical protein VX294_13295 [Candidatus Latescibacterota bacterium]|nr:hypothetical protein [Candidatus Latescibacterota bacterium]
MRTAAQQTSGLVCRRRHGSHVGNYRLRACPHPGRPAARRGFRVRQAIGDPSPVRAYAPSRRPAGQAVRSPMTKRLPRQRAAWFDPILLMPLMLGCWRVFLRGRHPICCLLQE